MVRVADPRSESQRDSISQPRVGGPSQPGEERLPWVIVPKIVSTLNGLHLRLSANGFNPFRVVFFSQIPPRVAASRQHWAEGCNRVAVGLREKLLSKIWQRRRRAIFVETRRKKFPSSR